MHNKKALIFTWLNLQIVPIFFCCFRCCCCYIFAMLFSHPHSSTFIRYTRTHIHVRSSICSTFFNSVLLSLHVTATHLFTVLGQSHTDAYVGLDHLLLVAHSPTIIIIIVVVKVPFDCITLVTLVCSCIRWRSIFRFVLHIFIRIVDNQLFMAQHSMSHHSRSNAISPRR